MQKSEKIKDQKFIKHDSIYSIEIPFSQSFCYYASETVVKFKNGLIWIDKKVFFHKKNWKSITDYREKCYENNDFLNKIHVIRRKCIPIHNTYNPRMSRAFKWGEAAICFYHFSSLIAMNVPRTRIISWPRIISVNSIMINFLWELSDWEKRWPMAIWPKSYYNLDK